MLSRKSLVDSLDELLHQLFIQFKAYLYFVKKKLCQAHLLAIKPVFHTRRNVHHLFTLTTIMCAKRAKGAMWKILFDAD